MTRVSWLVRFAGCVVFFLSPVTSYVPVPFQTKRTYGFDGPWQAVVVQVGGFKNGSTPSSQWTTVDLMPGGLWQNFVISQNYTQTHPSSNHNVTSWTPKGNQTQSGERIFYRPELDYRRASGLYLTGDIYAQNLNTNWIEQSFTTPNTSSAAVDQGNVTLPDGSVYPLDVGYLALGGDQELQTFPTSFTNATSIPIQAWNMPGYLYNQSSIRSFSYGLHIGSAALSYPGSLVFGGYDRGRAIGPGTVYADTPPQLLDIVIGVETGGSPFNFGSTRGLLYDSSGRHKSITANPDPVIPYLHLPKQTCDKLAQVLPIRLDAHNGYYLWNQNDPRYQDIINSPAYLGFVFPPAPGHSQDIIIKVPFVLLNLTLTQPAVKSGPVAYFPCRPYVPDPRNPIYLLGRAFLQAAFMGRTWTQHVSWLAQAPGPGSANSGLGAAAVDIHDDQTTLDYYTGDDLFKMSWFGIWKPLPGSTPPIPSTTWGSPSASPAKPRGLTTGAKVGIGMGAAIGCLLVGGSITICLYLRRKKSEDEPQSDTPTYPTCSELASPLASGSNENDKCFEAPCYFSRAGLPPEMAARQSLTPMELPANRLETPASQREPHELDSFPHRVFS
ncbi:hypothetical protein K461DRAFT_316399 [Myriangium duriaei CBS 260.36]|uniref:Peptidase A1 domain-containing protein n=1 Tax=Myriangium duriaei CBS 260.36 TaxID=1168546 RepID=A0A9P4MC84_9PEZI|nr:hypothetical protein K461DRAFT_316399 [Myriangium duriaei CBS 260.36]